MNDADFVDGTTGKLVPTGLGCSAFVPAPLPPAALDLRPMFGKIVRASTIIGELNGIGRRLPNPFLLVNPFMRREAVASSRIEGTVTSLPQLLLFEAEEMPRHATPDARETWNYVQALAFSLRRLETLPISGRLIREAHEVLLGDVLSGRGAHIIPGVFKKHQNHIGAKLITNARFVPPPPAETLDAMHALETYINDTSDETPLPVRLALVHYQFETIHPFPDGNGRVGRLLIPLMLAQAAALAEPLLYLSPYFENHYATYIDRMLAVSMRGEWLAWIDFFMDAIIDAGSDAIARIDKLQALRVRFHQSVQTKRSSALLMRLIDLLFERPAIQIAVAARHLGITYAAAKNNIERLEAEGMIVKYVEGRPQMWIASEILDALVV